MIPTVTFEFKKSYSRLNDQRSKNWESAAYSHTPVVYITHTNQYYKHKITKIRYQQLLVFFCACSLKNDLSLIYFLLVIKCDKYIYWIQWYS